MGDLSNLCEWRGRAKEGKGCSLVDGLRYCAKRSSPRTGSSRDCMTANVENLIEPVISAGLPRLTLSGLVALSVGTAAGTFICNIDNVPAGSTPFLILPINGSIALAGSQATGWKLVVGATPVTAGQIIALIVGAVGALPSIQIDITVAAFGRRTNAAVAYGYGRLTRNGLGAVALNSPFLGLTRPGAEVPTSFAVVQTSGTAAHWTKTAVNTPTKLAALTDGQYTFEVTSTFADTSIETSTITVTPLDNVYTMGSTDSGNTVGVTDTATISGKTVEFAAGADFTNVGVQYGRFIFGSWRPALATTVRPHDATRIGNPAGWEWQSCLNLVCDDLEANGSASGVNLGGDARFSLRLVTALYNENVVINRPKFLGTLAQFVSLGITRYGVQATGVRNCTINNGVFERTAGGIKGGGTIATQGVEGLTINNTTFRYFFDNGLITGYGGIQNYTLNDCYFISPMRLAATLGFHVDMVQLHDNLGDQGCIVTVNRCMAIHADGTAMIMGLYSSGGQNVTAAANGPQLIVDGWVCITGSVNSINWSLGQNITLRRVMTMYQRTNLFDPATEDKTFAETCRINLTPTGVGFAGANTIDRAVVWGNLISAPADWTRTNLVLHNGLGFAYPGGGEVFPDFVSGNYFNMDPTTRLRDAAWSTMTTAQVIATTKDILKPKLNGAYKLGDGSYVTAIDPYGNWSTNAAPVAP